MVMAVTKSPFLTVVHAMAHRKMRGVKMVVVVNHAVTNSAAIIAAAKTGVATKVAAAITVVAKPASATSAADHRSLAESPESTANAHATMAQSQQALVGTKML